MFQRQLINRVKKEPASKTICFKVDQDSRKTLIGQHNILEASKCITKLLTFQAKGQEKSIMLQWSAAGWVKKQLICTIPSHNGEQTTCWPRPSISSSNLETTTDIEVQAKAGELTRQLTTQTFNDDYVQIAKRKEFKDQLRRIWKDHN